jgi:hypothetical protein
VAQPRLIRLHQQHSTKRRGLPFARRQADSLCYLRRQADSLRSLVLTGLLSIAISRIVQEVLHLTQTMTKARRITNAGLIESHPHMNRKIRHTEYAIRHTK